MQFTDFFTYFPLGLSELIFSVIFVPLGILYATRLLRIS